MLNTYKKALETPGAWKFSLAGMLGRFPVSMIGISIILMVSTLYGNYATAGQVAGTGIIAYAVMAPQLARLVDAYGQARIMRPALLICSSAIGGLLASAWYGAPHWVLFVFAGIAGGTQGSIGAMVRSRWSYHVRNQKVLHTAFALEGVIDEFIFVVGPVLATVLTTGVHPTAGLAATGMFMLGGGLWFLSQKATEPPATPKPKGEKRRSVMFSGAMISLFLSNLMVGVVFGASDVAAVAFSDEYGMKSASGFVLAAYAGGSLISGMLYGARNWSLGPIRLYAIGVFMLAIGNTAFLLANSIPMLAFIMFLTGFSVSPTLININSLVQHTSPASRLTEGLTWMYTANAMGSSIGTSMAGSLIDKWDSHAAFGAVMVAAWVMFLVMAVTLPWLRRSVIRAKLRSAEAAAGSADSPAEAD